MAEEKSVITITFLFLESFQFELKKSKNIRKNCKKYT